MSLRLGKEANEQIGKEDGASQVGPLVWRLTAKGRAFEPLPGVPWEEMDEVRFAVVSAEHSRRHGFEAGSLERSGFFECVAVATGKEANEQTGKQPAGAEIGDVADEYDREVTDGAG